MHPSMPERVGPFALRELLSETQGIQVWRAERVVGERQPTAAVIRRAADPQDAATARLIQQEYETLRLLDDPRIPSVLGHFAGGASVALSYAPGPTLAQLILEHRQGRIRLQAAAVLDIVDDIAQALRHAHSRLHPTGRPVCHGHLSSRSVRLGPDGSIQLIGFGRALPPDAPGVLAPERLTEAPVSPAADQWALGALLLELLTGRALYEREGGGADLASRLEGRVEAEIEPVARKHPGLGRLLARLLAARPEQRFADEGELVRTLQELRRSLPGSSDRLALAEALATLRADERAPIPLEQPVQPVQPVPPALHPVPAAPAPLAPPPGPSPLPPPETTDSGASSQAELEVTEPVHPPPHLPLPPHEEGEAPVRPARSRLMAVEKLALGLALLFIATAVLALLASR